ncbi:1-deoxy-D-xylulose-5-phosphate synthase [Bacteroides helcogenes]|uniref:1-deoxy-D-xylulose-5-phosphate synthase n=1 Tax=Bacteroides helcogenes (strain ATCC 35417 / DSM 20613 / JCM 6297 / CCUG 15421 / P 36-108) TaxID=693979 RepID=E6SP70_BACT6|nr:1-deoxy-D-xylulose-5-phosphate synthase [Bacteroides helcogenes]ADV43840.1 1-deoxy-D-xylulose-5-phosphate synthase [Bacteroides helcogenes P 36-108]MDY5237470.1 1-deoxy-D-xylulose-5-phosphate synthase [Bacteroides helcogenes]
MYLENIYSPADVKKLSFGELNELSCEIRTFLLQKLSKHGGHFGPNFGMVEATIALHYVFDSPNDKIVFDVSHQSYVHKMLTGRKDAFIYPNRYDEVSGYSEPQESEHDFFVIGHTSTSVSLASGLAKGRDLNGENENIIAVIGDGSLSGGEAFEALDYVAELGTNMIIIINDNQMSIAENHGGLYRNLQELRESNGKCECNFFRAMGLDYMYVAEGNNVETLVKAFSAVKDISHPIVVHINTLKGKGYKPAEKDKEAYHWRAPFNTETGKLKEDYGDVEDYADITARYLLEKMQEDRRIVGITSGTPTVMGFTLDRRQKAGKQFVDVGIAEEHAVALASGIAANGGKPVYGVYSTFIQRAYDQLSQDLCINNNPAVLLIFWGSLSSMNDVTHLCFFDIPLISNIPNMVYLAPTCKEEYLAMLEWSIRQNEHPVAIRVPAMEVIFCNEPVDTDYSELNRYKVVHRGSKVAVVALGSFFGLGQSVISLLKEKTGIDATLINPRYITGVDNELMDRLKTDHQLVITLEDGVLDGGFGEKIARHYAATDMKVLNYGASKKFVDRYDVQELLRANRLTDEQIVEDIRKIGNFAQIVQ